LKLHAGVPLKVSRDRIFGALEYLSAGPRLFGPLVASASVQIAGALPASRPVSGRRDAPNCRQ
jgi:hypothetical protein